MTNPEDMEWEECPRCHHFAHPEEICDADVEDRSQSPRYAPDGEGPFYPEYNCGCPGPESQTVAKGKEGKA